MNGAVAATLEVAMTEPPTAMLLMAPPIAAMAPLPAPLPPMSEPRSCTAPRLPVATMAPEFAPDPPQIAADFHGADVAFGRNAAALRRRSAEEGTGNRDAAKIARGSADHREKDIAHRALDDEFAQASADGT